MNYIVSYKLSTAHKFPSIKAIAVRYKSAEDFLFLTLLTQFDFVGLQMSQFKRRLFQIYIFALVGLNTFPRSFVPLLLSLLLCQIN